MSLRVRPRLKKDGTDARHQDAQNDADAGGEQDGNHSPFETAGFFFYGQAGSGAGPMEQRKDGHAYCRFYGPPVCG